MADLEILIVDDEPLARQRLRRMLESMDGVKICGEAANGAEAVTLVEAAQPDLLFLDVSMPGMNGLEALSAMDDPPAVIFATAHEKHALRAFELEAVDYLLKPYSRERLGQAVMRARRLLSAPPGEATGASPPQRIPADSGLGTALIDPADIVLARIDEGVVFIVCRNSESLSCGFTLQELEGRLPPSQFFRASRRAIINVAAVESFEPQSDGSILVRLEGGQSEIVSRRRARHFRSRIAAL